MPRRHLLSASERASPITLPDTEEEPARYYTLTETDLSLIRQRRGEANRLGIAVQLCLLRYPGQGLRADAAIPMRHFQRNCRHEGLARGAVQPAQNRYALTDTF
jgi:TnpA family transposase